MRGRELRLLAVLVALGCAAMCAREHLSTTDDAATTKQSTARALREYSPELPASLVEQAEQELARDARRRENRFVAAVQPGSPFAATRLDERDLSERSPRELYEIGAQLFHLRFRRADGFGARDLPALGRVQRGLRGGPDASRCADCHRRGGPAGGGDLVDMAFLDGDGDRPSSALARNPIALQGAGVVEILAREMTADLATQRAALLAQARSTGQPQSVTLTTKTVSFGTLTALPSGHLNTTGIRGIDTDLVVKPFGWKGHAATLRDVVEVELALHHGMQSTHLAQSADPSRVGHFGRPDPDGDGITEEITEGQLGALTLFVALQAIPQQDTPRDPKVLALLGRGKEMFDKMGCAGCHVTSLPLDNTVYELPSRTGGETVRIDLAEHGGEPRLRRTASGDGYRVFLFSDLKRHVMGKHLTESRRYRGVSPATYITRPLWGLARSRPYLHDARAPTLEAAILAHGGEARKASKEYAALSDAQRAPLRIYLSSLTRARRLVAD